MVHRYREPVDVEAAGETPRRLTWRGRSFTVVAVTGHWREDPGWWRAGDGRPVQGAQHDLWRVEAAPDDGATSLLAELSRAGDAWRLERVYD